MVASNSVFRIDRENIQILENYFDILKLDFCNVIHAEAVNILLDTNELFVLSRINRTINTL